MQRKDQHKLFEAIRDVVSEEEKNPNMPSERQLAVREKQRKAKMDRIRAASIKPTPKGQPGNVDHYSS